MDSKELEKTIKADLDWFKNFDDDLQFNMFITLLQLGGSPLTEKMSIYIREQASKLMIMMDNQSDDNIKILNESKLSSGTGCFMYTQYCQSNDPSFVIVQKKQKEWADLMMKYRKEVEAKVGKGAAKEKGKKGKKGKKEKKGKKGKKEKVGKKSKKSKKSKSKKGKKEKNTSDIDYVQVMPINVVKKILSFLDKKTLGIVSKVNEYWKYAVSSLNEDMKARKMLDKLMETHRVETRLVDPKLSTKIFNKSRVDRLWREIASSKQIKNSLKVSKKERSDYTLLQKAVQEIPEEYILPVYNLSSFSRKVPQDEDTNLYESPAKIRHELGYKQKPTTDELDPVGMIQMIRKKSIAQMQEEYIKNFDDDDDDDLIPADACPSSLFIPYQSGMSNF
ncbi:PREDICTED: uncharacterized protein LOC108566984 [Nicrophorus vespilloides]|uniref:Uncharacterized protein LOC108566984 n=1 Tax=Nicrophorus vespilloides TaxID=110193 RepID=A0ABM1N743_NICVS|nr:PREDICTED: uncharacterized protein LOC108566984 [Nicrophorus vespilloides]